MCQANPKLATLVVARKDPGDLLPERPPSLLRYKRNFRRLLQCVVSARCRSRTAKLGCLTRLCLPSHNHHGVARARRRAARARCRVARARRASRRRPLRLPLHKASLCTLTACSLRKRAPCHPAQKRSDQTWSWRRCGRKWYGGNHRRPPCGCGRVRLRELYERRRLLTAFSG